MSKAAKFFTISMLALAVTGCAVTSQPIDRSVSEQRAQRDLATMFKDQEPLSGPLTLHDAMARAVKYNLEARLKVMEEALAKRQVDLASFDMLPRIAMEAGYAGRSNVSASSSTATGPPATCTTKPPNAGEPDSATDSVAASRELAASS